MKTRCRAEKLQYEKRKNGLSGEATGCVTWYGLRGNGKSNVFLKYWPR